MPGIVSNASLSTKHIGWSVFCSPFSTAWAQALPTDLLQCCSAVCNCLSALQLSMRPGWPSNGLAKPHLFVLLQARSQSLWWHGSAAPAPSFSRVRCSLDMQELAALGRVTAHRCAASCVMQQPEGIPSMACVSAVWPSPSAPAWACACHEEGGCCPTPDQSMIEAN